MLNQDLVQDIINITREYTHMKFDYMVSLEWRDVAHLRSEIIKYIPEYRWEDYDNSLIQITKRHRLL